MEGVALDTGWPVWLSDLKPLITTSPGLKLIMTLLVSFRGIHLEPKLDTTPIISPWAGSDTITVREFGHAMRQLGIPKAMKLEWSGFHMSTKSGPLGQAILTSVTELTLLPADLVNNIKVLGGDSLGRVIDALMVGRFGDLSLAQIWATLFPAKTKSFRKLSYFSDKEGKTRVIAILDYWSQTALRPYHDLMNRLLKRIPCDQTFDQNKFTSASLPGPYHSLDLSNATDRMPIKLQRRLIGWMFGEERAAAWAHVLVGYEYNSKGNPSVTYNAGQPMGAYSSWTAMALTHHLLVRVAALRAGFPHFTSYFLLGDDIVIANADVATAYRKLLFDLDMPISEAKTHVSNDTFEFAKRWFHKGEEITGFSIAGIGSVWKRYSLLHNYLSTQLAHGWKLEIERHPELISSIYRLYGKPQQAERVIKLYMVFDALAQAKHTGDYQILVSRVEVFFGVHILQRVQTESACTLDISELGKALHVEAAKRLVERDFGRFQRDAYSVSAKLTGAFLRKFPDLDVQSYRASLRGIHPLVTVLNQMILASAHVLNKEFGKSIGIQTARSSQYQAIQGWDESQRVPESTYLNVGLSKYFVSKGVFSMRASHSLSLADSMLVKCILDISREYVDQKWSPMTVVEPLAQVVDTPVEGETVRRKFVPHIHASGPTIYLFPAGGSAPSAS
nr:MAG: putative RNA-dependent RNA polymerase [Mitoviridae sp.]